MALPLAQLPARPHAAHRAENPHRIFEAPRPLAIWHLASLDAPTVAVVWALGFAWAGGIHLPQWVPILLALVAWSVYVGDRLADAGFGLSRAGSARGPAHAALRERHFFHWRHRRVFIPLAAAATCASAAIVLALMPPAEREPDLMLAVAAFAYFLSVHLRRGEHGAIPHRPRRFFSKELLVGLLFTAGCLLPSWPGIDAEGPAHAALWQFWIPGVYFAALAWMNCRCIARWESDGVERSILSPSIPSESSLAPMFLAFAGALLAGLAEPLNERAAALIAMGAGSALLLALLDRTRAHFSALALRTLADLVLLTPLFLLLR